MTHHNSAIDRNALDAPIAPKAVAMIAVESHRLGWTYERLTAHLKRLYRRRCITHLTAKEAEEVLQLLTALAMTTAAYPKAAQHNPS
jgi:hypothetical protein